METYRKLASYPWAVRLGVLLLLANGIVVSIAYYSSRCDGDYCGLNVVFALPFVLIGGGCALFVVPLGVYYLIRHRNSFNGPSLLVIISMIASIADLIIVSRVSK